MPAIPSRRATPWVLVLSLILISGPPLSSEAAATPAKTKGPKTTQPSQLLKELQGVMGEKRAELIGSQPGTLSPKKSLPSSWGQPFEKSEDFESFVLEGTPGPEPIADTVVRRDGKTGDLLSVTMALGKERKIALQQLQPLIPKQDWSAALERNQKAPPSHEQGRELKVYISDLKAELTFNRIGSLRSIVWYVKNPALKAAPGGRR
jgi:hypothetical protein